MPRRRSHTVTPQKKAEFLSALAETGQVQRAAQQVGFAPSIMYRHARTDPAFAQQWEATMQQAMDTVLEPEAIRRAVAGVEKAVYYKGEQVGVEREYSDTLLIFLLKGWKSDRYKDRSAVFHRGAVALLRKLERLGRMTPDELQAFLQEVEQYVNELDDRS